jgi:hypothetical protein
MNPFVTRHTSTAVLAGLFAFLTGPASAQMFNKPWDFEPTDRAGLAVYMHQAATGTGGTNQYVCGGAQQSATATGNSICIIVGDGANANIDAGQDMIGDATANNSTQDLIDQLAAPPQ